MKKAALPKLILLKTNASPELRAQPLQRLMKLLDDRVRASGCVRIDDTRVQVLNGDKTLSALHWIWLQVAAPKPQRIILFNYDASRCGEITDGLAIDTNIAENDPSVCSRKKVASRGHRRQGTMESLAHYCT